MINGTSKHNISALSSSKLLFILSLTNPNNSCLKATLRGHTTLLPSQVGGILNHNVMMAQSLEFNDFQPSVMDETWRPCHLNSVLSAQQLTGLNLSDTAVLKLSNELFPFMPGSIEISKRTPSSDWHNCREKFWEVLGKWVQCQTAAPGEQWGMSEGREQGILEMRS